MKVVYCEQMVADAQSFSPSARKPREVVGSWRRRFPVLSMVEPQPVSVDQLCLAHDPGYVRGVLSLRLANGFGNHLPEVAQSLPWTSGAMLGAARWAAGGRARALLRGRALAHRCGRPPLRAQPGVRGGHRRPP